MEISLALSNQFIPSGTMYKDSNVNHILLSLFLQCISLVIILKFYDVLFRRNMYFFQAMAENKEELGAAYLQEMYEVNANPEDVSKI